MAKVDATHLVVSCIDHRCTNDVVAAMHHVIHGVDPHEQHPEERYDLIALPGASLGALQKTYAAWGEAFWQQVWAARALHSKITTIVVFDHLDCGAYKKLYWHLAGRDYGDATATQLLAHQEMLEAFETEAKRRFPGISVSLFVLEPTSADGHRWQAVPLDGSAAIPCV